MTFRIDPNKILNYLLSEATPPAAGKSRFFRGIGFAPEDWRALRDALLRHPETARLEYEDGESPYGRKSVFRCDLPAAPNGKIYCIRSVWQLRGDAWWFLTAYPWPGA